MAVEALRLQRTQQSTELLVLATGGGCLAAVDMTTGGLVRAPLPDGSLAPYDVVRSRVSDMTDRDPAAPETIEFDQPVEFAGRLRGRRAERFVRPLLHPPNAPLLGMAGAAVPYWTLCGDRPSLAVVDPAGPLHIVRHGRRLHCFFDWRGATIDLPVVDARVGTSMARRGQQSFSIRRRFVLALTPPHNGNCYKVIAGLLPRA